MRKMLKIYDFSEDCQVECIPDKCCLEQEEEEDCDSLQIIGGCFIKVPAGESRTVRLAAPLLNSFDRRGYCVLHLYSQPKGHGIFWDTITIPFDTGGEADVTLCARVDQNPLNNCHPVDCDTHYNGQKPHYNRTLRRCLQTPPCSKKLMYDPRTNECVEQVTRKDIRHIKSMIKRKKRRKHTSKTKTHTAKANSEIIEKSEEKLSKSAPDTLASKAPSHKWNSVGALTLIICTQCCVVVALVFCVRNRCKCMQKEKEVVNKYINTRDSITTPLLSTNCTLTTCQYHSESSSNIDRKIKSYKAFRKDQTKISMSDDILARCVKRRDWTRPKSNEVISENKETENVVETVNFDEAVEYKCVCDIDKAKVSESSPVDTQSEEEVKCLDYEEKLQDFIFNLVNVSRGHDKVTGKGAQVSLSRDSIDEFLSEHGINFLGESRYAFSDTSNMSSGASSKNVVQSLHRLGPSSDPGGGASEDLELLHMSRASLFSSSITSLHTAMKRTRESRSSL